MFFRSASARMLVAAGLAAGIVLAPLMSFAHAFKVGSIEIEHPWSRATPPAAKVAGGYLALKNTGAEDDRLVSVASPVSPSVQIHEMKTENGVMTMRELSAGLPIPAGGEVRLAPGGLHLMLTGLKTPLKQGDRVPLTLTFAKAGSIDVWLQVDAIGAKEPSTAGTGDGHDHHAMPMP